MNRRTNDQLWAFVRTNFTDAQVVAFLREASTHQGRRLNVPADKRAWAMTKWFVQDLHPEVARRYLDELARRKTAHQPLVREHLLRRIVVRAVPKRQRKRAKPATPRDPLSRWRWRGGPGVRKPKHFG